MEVLKFLNSYDMIIALDELEFQYGIKSTYSEDYDLWVLNYSQIDSVKFKDHPIVKECRSLVLNYDYKVQEWKVVSRAFDRFFNIGEVPAQEDITACVAHEKVDGSLVSVFYHIDRWLFRTKSMIMPDETMSIHGHDYTWKQLVEDTTGFPGAFEECDVDKTYIYECCSMANRVVVRYPEAKSFLLAIRDKSGKYYDSTAISEIKTYSFSSVEDCLKNAKSLPNLEEGYVLYDRQGVPCMKAKTPAYTAAFHLRGETSFTPKRIMDLCIIEETSEYLTIFPEDAELFRPYIEALEELKSHFNIVWALSCRYKSRKELAMDTADLMIQGLIMSKFDNRNATFSELFSKLTRKAKHRVIIHYKNLLDTQELT